MNKLNLRFIMTVVVLALTIGAPNVSTAGNLTHVDQPVAVQVQKAQPVPAAPVQEKGFFAKVFDAISGAVGSVTKFLRGDDKDISQAPQTVVKADPPVMMPGESKTGVLQMTPQDEQIAEQVELDAQVAVNADPQPIDLKQPAIAQQPAAVVQAAPQSAAPSVAQIKPTVTIATIQPAVTVNQAPSEQNYLKLPENIEQQNAVVNEPGEAVDLEQEIAVEAPSPKVVASGVQSITPDSPKIAIQQTAPVEETRGMASQVGTTVVVVPQQITVAGTSTGVTTQLRQPATLSGTNVTTGTVATTDVVQYRDQQTIQTAQPVQPAGEVVGTQTTATTREQATGVIAEGNTLQTQAQAACKPSTRSMVPGTIVGTALEGNYIVAVTDAGKKYIVSICDGRVMECPPEEVEPPAGTVMTRIEQEAETNTAQQESASAATAGVALTNIAPVAFDVSSLCEIEPEIASERGTITTETTRPEATSVENVIASDRGVTYTVGGTLRYVENPVSNNTVMAEDSCEQYSFDILPTDSKDGIELSFVAIKNGKDVSDSFTVSFNAVNEKGVDVSPLVTTVDPSSALLKASVVGATVSESKMMPEFDYAITEGDKILDKITVHAKAAKGDLVCKKDGSYFVVGKAVAGEQVLPQQGEVGPQQQATGYGGATFGGGCSLIR